MTKKKNLTVDDIWKIERIGGVSLSPDGAQAVCAVTRFTMDDNKSASSLWLLSTFGGGPRQLTSCGEKDGQAAWSPTGERIAFVARREQEGRKDDTPQIYVIAPDGGEARRVSDFAPGIDAYKWFPDGKRIAFISWVWPGLKGTKAQAKRFKEFQDRKETAYITSEAHYRHWDRNLPMERVPHLHVLDVATGRVRDLFEGTDFEIPRADPDANGFDISADGGRIVFAFDPAKEKQNSNCKALAELQLRSGNFGTLALDPAWDFEAPRYSPDGRTIAFLARNQGRKHTMPTWLALVQPGDPWRVVSDTWDHAVHAPLRWSDDAAVTVVVAAPGYPFAPVSGGVIEGLDVLEGTDDHSLVLHAGTALDGEGHVVVGGGRVLSVVGVGRSLVEAREAAYARVAQISLDGAQHRTDIAQAAAEAAR